mgnify:CR=1 FL=1
MYNLKENSSRKKVVLVTDATFWERKMGSHQRILALCLELKKYFDLKVFVFNSIGKNRKKQITEFGLEENIFSYKNYEKNDEPDNENLPRLTSFADYPGLKKRRHITFFKSFARFLIQEQPDVTIVQYIYLAYLHDAIPYQCLSVIDTHDIMCYREYRFRAHGLGNSISMSVSVAEEKSILERFDVILSIQRQEHELHKQLLPGKLAILCPHAINLSGERIKPSKLIRSIGFIGANNEANCSGLRWFLLQVWPVVRQLGVKLYIFGSVGEQLHEIYQDDPLVHYMSSNLKQDEIYSMTDCMINPVFVGGGLKIKTVEALAYGKPIVSTKEGVTGIGQEGSNGALVANNRAEFINALISLILQPDLVERLAFQGQRLIRQYFSIEACYSSLVNFLQYYQILRSKEEAVKGSQL